jgi:putative FmdB family regulatory protein
MPIYEYACSACGHAFEMLQPVGAAPPTACPACEASEVRKLVSATSFVLKGGGWYRDGYGLKPNASTDSDKASTSASASASEPASTSAPKAEPARAAKAAAK